MTMRSAHDRRVRRRCVSILLLTLGWLIAGGSANGACEFAPDVLTAQTYGDDDGIGGTGHSPDERAGDDDGIGGTGIRGDDDGVGGTGILGTVTGFGSLCINGLRVHYDDDVRVTADDAEASAGDLAVGQVVWIRAELDRAVLRAERIAILSALVGRITAIEADRRSLEIDGHDVVISPDTRIGDGLAGLGSLTLGERVRISGLLGPEGIVASRIDAARPEAPARFSPVQIERLVAQTPGLTRLSVESYVGDRPIADELRLSGLSIDLSALDARVRGLAPDTRVWVSGRVVDGARLRADRFSVRPAPVERPTRPERPSGGFEEPRDEPKTRPDARRAPRPSAEGVPPDRPRTKERPQVERPGRPDRPQRAPRPERPEVIERPPTIERPAVIDRPTTLP